MPEQARHARTSPTKTKQPKKTAKKAVKPAPERTAEKAKKPLRAVKSAPVQGRAKAKPPARRAPVDWQTIEGRLAHAVPNPVCELHFDTPFELLIATILAAQSTDRTVNSVMPTLLATYPTSHALAEAPQDDVEALVKRTGFFRNKAKAIRGTAAQLVAEHAGEVPRDLDALVALPGVARKTANVVLGTAFRIPSGFVVDTHVTRVSQRLGLTREKDPVRIEQDLCRGFPESSWIDLGHRLVLHGRYTCLARTPKCKDCPLNELCPSRTERAYDAWEARALRERKLVDDALS